MQSFIKSGIMRLKFLPMGLLIFPLCLGALYGVGVAQTVTMEPGAVKSAKPPLKSPRGSADVTLDGKKITVDYGRPFMRGRKIMGGLVPYGTVWRTGANAATSLVTETDITVEGMAVPKGSYTLFTLPSENGWKLIISKQTGQWGTDYDQTKDFARIDMKKEKLNATLDQFTISFDKKSEDNAALNFDWENTRLSVKIAVKK